MATLETTVAGKLIEREDYNGKTGKVYKHIVLMPAEDEFSYPNVVAVLGSRSHGSIGSIVEIQVEIRGRTNKVGDRKFYNHELWEKV